MTDREDSKRSIIRRLDGIPHCKQTGALEGLKQDPDVIHFRKVSPCRVEDWSKGARGREVS